MPDNSMQDALFDFGWMVMRENIHIHTRIKIMRITRHINFILVVKASSIEAYMIFRITLCYISCNHSESY